MPQIALVSHQHDHDVRIRMVSQFLQPSGDVLVRRMLADVIDKQGAYGSSIVCRCDGPVTLLSRSIPNLEAPVNGLCFYES